MKIPYSHFDGKLSDGSTGIIVVILQNRKLIWGANIPNLTKIDLSKFNISEWSLLHIYTDGGRFYSELYRDFLIW